MKNSGLVHLGKAFYDNIRLKIVFTLSTLTTHFSLPFPGNELLHNLTSVGPVSLRVDMQSGNDTAYAHYTNFSIASENRHYALTVSGYTGTAGTFLKTGFKNYIAIVIGV